MSEKALLEVSDARARILALVRPLSAQSAPVEDALGRALAEDVRADRTLPPWDNSAMDGYAVRAEDVQAVPARLAIIERIYAGQRPQRTVGPGQCARIMTGAPMPAGATAVVMQEKTLGVDAEHVDIQEPVPPGASVRRAGEDAQVGKVLLAAGTPLGIPEAGLLWAQGVTQVRVPRRPRVALFSCGDELCEVTDAPQGRIVDTNAPSLAAAVRRAGGVPTALGIARDSVAAIGALLERTAGFDVVLSSAGVSVGEKDFVREALERAGVEMSFWKVAIRPGKPLAAGSRGNTLFVCLPGNPTSSLVTFELFVRPALRRLQGVEDVAPASSEGRSEEALQKAAGLTHYLRVTSAWRDGHLWARPLRTQTSGALRSAASATHLLVFPSAATRLSAGDPVELLPVSWAGPSEP